MTIQTPYLDIVAQSYKPAEVELNLLRTRITLLEEGLRELSYIVAEENECEADDIIARLLPRQ